MRLCQPYGDDQRKGLWLFKMLEPETWSRVVGRVQGPISAIVMWNFPETCSATSVSVFRRGTWRSYAEFLLDTMPPPTAEHYREKINTFLKWWAKHGFEEIPQEADPKLESRRKAPSWRRICKTLLKNDYWCKGLSFGQTKRDMERQAQTIMKYMEL
ncbi:MAG: DUF3440 domain-containing protein [Bilophila wadsworthia]